MIRKTYKAGKKAYLKACSNEYWDIIIEEMFLQEEYGGNDDI